LEEHPDSALSLLQDLSDRSSMTDADKAYYALLMTAATDKNALSLLPCDSLLDDALLYYGDKDKEKAVALLYKGRLFAEMNDPKSAIEYSLKALDVLQYYPEDIKYRRLIYGALGLWYGKQRLFDMALEASMKYLDYSNSLKDSSIAYNNLSYVYLMKDLKDSSLFLQKRAIDYILMADDSITAVKFWHNLSLRYRYFFDNKDSALYYAQKVIANSCSESDGYGSYCGNLGELYWHVDDIDSARFYLSKSIDGGNMQMGNLTLSSLESSLGNYEKAYNYLDEYVCWLDSIQRSKQVTEIQHLVYKHRTEMKVQEEKSILRFKGFVIIACVVIILLLVTVFYQHKVNKKEKETALSKQALCHAEKRLCEMKQRINENESAIDLLREKEDKYGTEIVQRENVIMQLNDEAFALRFWLFKNTRIYKKIQLLQKQEVSSKKERKVMSADEHQELKNTVFEIYVDYISSLKNRHPRLTDDDLLLLCLQKMDFPSLTIALCFGYSDTSTINQRKSRLKAKMS
jgi:tetratricopeptide (TPR) repeat protein